MSRKREDLLKALRLYITDTFNYIETARGFCEMFSKWLEARKTELRNIKSIKDKRPSNTVKFMRDMLILSSVDSELEKELAAVLKDTVHGLKKLECFLDAMEKLAVTSLHVFMKNKVLHLPKEISCERVQLVIIAAQLTCHLLLDFKRDTSALFCPKIQNAEVLSYHLDRYMQTTNIICDTLKKSCIFKLSHMMDKKVVVDLDVDLSEDDLQKMLDHINQLGKIRMDPNFRMVFLFQEVSCSRFISQFKERQPRMLECLKELEEIAVQLDRMNKGAKISSVAGSSVGAVGGVLSIIGLVLAPFTAGGSLAMTIGGLGLGITSGLNSIVTTATEAGVNATQQNKAGNVIQSFMKDMQGLQDCLEEVVNQPVTKVKVKLTDVFMATGKIGWEIYSIYTRINSLAEAVSQAKALKNGELISSVGDVAVQEGNAVRAAERVASEIPEATEAAVSGPLSLSRSARVRSTAFNAFFIGLDIYFICKDSISLAKGSETEVSKFIRARAALWRSEMDSWEKISELLCKGLPRSEKNKAVLNSPFLTEGNQKKTKGKIYLIKSVNVENKNTFVIQ